MAKPQKKKRKPVSANNAQEASAQSPLAVPDAHAAAFIEKAPEPAEIKEGAVAPELVAQPDATQSGADEYEGSKKHSSVVELIYKRMRTLSKKIVSSLLLMLLQLKIDSFLPLIHAYRDAFTHTPLNH